MTRAGPILAFVTLIAVAGLVPPVAWAAPPAGAATPLPADPYEHLRALALRIRPDEIGAAGSGVYGVVADLQVGGRRATLTVLADGEASLYLTDGRIIGGAATPETAKAAAILLDKARASLGELHAAADFPSPPAGEVRFQVLTPGGVMVGGEAEAKLAGGGRPLSSLYAAAQAVAALAGAQARP